jgi:hypothetical protein
MLFLSLFSLHFVCDLRVSFLSRSFLNIIFLVRHFEILEVCNEAFLVSFNLPRQVALIRHLFEGFANAECQVFATDVTLVNLVINHDRGMEHQVMLLSPNTVLPQYSVLSLSIAFNLKRPFNTLLNRVYFFFAIDDDSAPVEALSQRIDRFIVLNEARI